jgi:hypothetical protein
MWAEGTEKQRHGHMRAEGMASRGLQETEWGLRKQDGQAGYQQLFNTECQGFMFCFIF